MKQYRFRYKPVGRLFNCYAAAQMTTTHARLFSPASTVGSSSRRSQSDNSAPSDD